MGLAGEKNLKCETVGLRRCPIEFGDKR